MTDRAPYLPWTPEWSRLAVRGRVIVKVASGEAPDRVPHAAAVNCVEGTPLPMITKSPHPG